MECIKTDEHTNHIIDHFKKRGIECVEEVTVGNRRFDIKCADLNIEVKNTCEDYNSLRSQEQISDMTHYSNLLDEGFVVSTPCECFESKNEKGEESIKKYGLVKCVTKSENSCCCTNHEPE